MGSTDGTGTEIATLRYRFDDLAEIPISLTGSSFDQAINFAGIANGAHTLTLTSTDVAGNITTQQFTVIVNLDMASPVIAAGLANDTGISADLITADPTIIGTLTDTSAIAQFNASFGVASPSFDVLSDRGADGRFTFTRERLEQIYGSTLPDGAHTLRLQASDPYGNISQIFEFTFVLDTTLPLSFALDPAFDSTPVGDQQTTNATVSLMGQTDVGATVTLQQTGTTAIADASGQFVFANVTLALGSNVFTVQAVDSAGNQQSNTLTITRLATNAAPTDILLSYSTVAENSVGGTVIGQLSAIDSDAADTHQYTLLDDAVGRFQLVGNQLQVAPDARLDFETTSVYTVRVRTTDSGTLVCFTTRHLQST